MLTPVDHPQFDDALRALERDGFAILSDLLDPEVMSGLWADFTPAFEDARFSIGPFYGHRTKRFGRLLARSRHAADLALHPLILKLVRAVLDSDTPQLNLTQAIAIHPGARVQPPHRDQDMWRFEKRVDQTCMINVMWALDPFTRVNGATRIWPGSHKDPSAEVLPDDAAAEAVLSPGSAILFLGQTLHAGGANRSNSVRRGLIFSYCLDWLLPDENPWLAYPPEIARSFSPELRTLIGYKQRFAGLNNFEGQCPAVLLEGEPSNFHPFTDAMSSDQEALIEAYYASIGHPDPNRG